MRLGRNPPVVLHEAPRSNWPTFCAGTPLLSVNWLGPQPSASTCDIGSPSAAGAASPDKDRATWDWCRNPRDIAESPLRYWAH